MNIPEMYWDYGIQYYIEKQIIIFSLYKIEFKKWFNKNRSPNSFALQNDSPVGAFDITKAWSLAEETMLLDAVEQYGFGNWQVFKNWFRVY